MKIIILHLHSFMIFLLKFWKIRSLVYMSLNIFYIFIIGELKPPLFVQTAGI